MQLSDLVRDKSVALVGNSERILRERPSRIIDNHDVVIRINRGLPGIVDPNAIGARCDIWATAKYWPDATKACMAKHVLWMKLTRLGEEHLAQLEADVAMVGKYLWEWQKDDEDECREFVGADPGTGIRILWWLRTKCSPRSVSCFGMDCWEVPSHWSGRKNTPNHHPELERAAMLKLL